MGRRQQSNEGWDSPSIHDGLGLFRGPRSNVSECPGRLKLNRVAIRSAQEGHELGNQTSSDYVVNWGLFFPGEQFPKKVQGKHKLKVLSLRINNFKFKKIFKRLNSRVKNIKARQSLLGEAPWNFVTTKSILLPRARLGTTPLLFTSVCNLTDSVLFTCIPLMGIYLACSNLFSLLSSCQKNINPL